LSVCFTIFTEHQEWFTFMPAGDAVSAYSTWTAGVEPRLDVSGLDEDGQTQRAIFLMSSIIGMSISDATRWKRPAPPAEFLP
jgi:hypothetical protein